MDIKAATSEAKKIIDGTDLLVLATSDLKGNIWIAPLRYAHDNRYNFYFHSALTRLHSQHILENPKVAFTIISADADTCVQATGTAHVVEEDSIQEAMRIYAEARYPLAMRKKKGYQPERFLSHSDERFFKIGIVSAYIKFPEEVSHERIEIKLGGEISW